MPTTPDLDAGTGYLKFFWSHPLLAREHSFSIGILFDTPTALKSVLAAQLFASVTALKTPFDSTITFTHAEAVFADTSADSRVDFTIGYSGDAAAGDMSVATCAPVVSKKTVQRGRRFQGRFFLPPVRESEVNVDGSYTGTVRADIQAAVDTWATELVDGTNITDFCLLHPEPLKHFAAGDTDNPLNPANTAWVQTGWSNTPLQWTTFPQFLAVNDRVGTQRLRLRR